MKTLIIDNYDSFTYNLLQFIAELGGDPLVVKNDAVMLADIQKLAPTHIVISPGPGTVTNSSDFGVCAEAIREFSGKIPILGVCLGHQGIAACYGAKIVHAPEVMHGKSSTITHDETSALFHGVPQKTPVMRYHSLVIEESTLPQNFTVTARSEDGLCMAIEDKKLTLFGVQFHPESIGTPYGKTILANFLAIG